MMKEELKTNIKSEVFWVRTLFALVFLVIFGLMDIFVWILVLAQWLFCLFTGKPNVMLQRFSDSLSTFVAQVVAYLGYTTSEKPFPFQEWPVADQKFSKNVRSAGDSSVTLKSEDADFKTDIESRS